MSKYICKWFIYFTSSEKNNLLVDTTLVMVVYMISYNLKCFWGYIKETLCAR